VNRDWVGAKPAMKYASTKYWRLSALLDNLNTPNRICEWSGEARTNPTYRQTVACPTCTQSGVGDLFHIICECNALQAKRSEHISRFKTVLTKLLTSKINKNKRAHGAAHPASLSLQILQQTLDRHFPASFLKQSIYPSAKPTDWVPTRVPIAFQHRWNALATDPNMMALLQSDPDGALFSNTVKNKIATLVFEAHHAVWNHYWNRQKTNDEANTPSSPSATQQMTQPTPGPPATQATQTTQATNANTTTGGETTQTTAPEDRKRRRLGTNKRSGRRCGKRARGWRK